MHWEDAGVPPEFGLVPRQDTGTVVETLNLRRVEDALATLVEEQDIADAMAGKPPRERHHHPWIKDNDRNAGYSGNPDSGSNYNSNRALIAAAPGGVESEASEAGVTLGHSATTKGLQKTGRNSVAEMGDFGPDGLNTGEMKINGRNKKKMRDVFAVYKHRGAQLVLAQSRNKHPFRVDGMFCRPDRGEWAGQVTE